VAALVDQSAAPHLANFIDAIGELKTTVFDSDRGLRMRKIASVDVSDA